MRRTALLVLLIASGCATQRVLFDDFNYTNTQQLKQHGWIIRSAPGWPGIPGATWGGISVPAGASCA